MGLKLFADRCVPFSIIQSLREAGIEVLVLKDHIPPDSPDLTVISKADELDAVLISMDGDFADIVSYPPDKYQGIKSLQVRNHPETIPLLISRLKSFFSDHPAKDDYTIILES